MTAVEVPEHQGNGGGRPANVIEALAAVRVALPAVGKTEQASAAQGNYSYRGIEAVTAAAGPLLGRFGVVFVPEVVDHRVDQITVANKPWTDTTVTFVYRVYGPGGIEDCLRVGPLVAVGRDNSDKGYNKAASQAFKYALLQVLCIGDSKDDVDGTTHEADAPLTADQQAQSAGWADAATSKAEHADYSAAFMDLTEDQKEKAKARKAELGIGWPMTPEQMKTMVDVLVELDVADAKEHVADSEQQVIQPVPARVERLTPRLRAMALQQAHQAGLPAPTEPMTPDTIGVWMVLLDKLDESTKPFTEDDETLARRGE